MVITPKIMILGFFDSLSHERRLKSIPETYIYHQNKKSKPHKLDLPLLNNDITNIFDL